MENKEDILTIDSDSLELSETKVIVEQTKEEKVTLAKKKAAAVEEESVNCLKNERIIVRFIPRATGLVSNPKHLLYGGMAEGASRTFVVPKLSSGNYVNILTDSEKSYLEEIMGLEFNTLSVYKRVNNFWDDSNENGISKVTLRKQDNYFNLSSPEDYIKYKILLANKDFIAPSMQVLQDSPKITYQFVIIHEGEESKKSKLKMSTTMECYTEFGAIKDDVYKLRVIVEGIEGKPTAKTVKLEFLQERVNDLIQSQGKLFLDHIKDQYLDTKVIIKKGIEEGLISNRGGMLYLKSDGSPLCNHNEEPTLNIASRYLNDPKRQDLLFSLQAKLK